MSGFLVGAAAIGGGLTYANSQNWWQKPKSSPGEQGPPIPKSLQSIKGFNQPYEQLIGRTKQGPSNFNFTDLSEALAAQQRATWAGETLPSMQEAYAGRGLFRSGAAIRDESQGAAGVERDIAEQRANLGIQSRKWGEEIYDRDINTLINMSLKESDQRNLAASDEQLRTQNISNYVEKERASRQQAGQAAIGQTISGVFGTQQPDYGTPDTESIFSKENGLDESQTAQAIKDALAKWKASLFQGTTSSSLGLGTSKFG